MRLSVVGLGHVGLVTSAAVASLGHEVVGTDADAERVESLRRGQPPFHEPGLPELLARELETARLRVTHDLDEAVAEAAAVFVCVGRPPLGEGDRSLTAVEDVVRRVARAASEGVVVIVKSTVPPGTAGRIAQVMEQERPQLRPTVVSSPEFLREGHAIEDTLSPDRLVIGADDRRGVDTVREIYAALVDRDVRVIETDPRTAELSKLASNAFLATKISYANSLARIAERSGADVVRVAEIMGADPRIGPGFLAAGLGYGGYCLPKDVETLARVAERMDVDFGLLRETAKVNEEALDAVTRAVEEAVWNLEGKRIALLGLAFKPGTDDVRSSPALSLARRLASEGATVVGHDPAARAAAGAEMPELEIVGDPYVAASGAHCVVLCTDWPEYRSLDVERLAKQMVSPVIVDGRNLFDPEEMRAAGITYVPTGRPGES